MWRKYKCGPFGDVHFWHKMSPDGLWHYGRFEKFKPFSRNFGQKIRPPMVRRNNEKSAVKRVVMRLLGKKEITFAWYTNVISYVYVYYQKVLCYKVCATKSTLFCRFCACFWCQ